EAAQQEIGQHDQQTEHDQRHSGRRPGHGRATGRSAAPCPPSGGYSPLSALRNRTMRPISCGASARPSWIRALSATASSSVAARPSWKYGAVLATLRKLGTRNTERSSALPVSANRPRSARVGGPVARGSSKTPNRSNRLPPTFAP